MKKAEKCILSGLLLGTLFSGTTHAATPTLVQHVATGMDRYPIGTLTIPLPNPVRSGNALILGVQFHSTGLISSITDDGGNTWVTGPTTTNVAASQTMSIYYALGAAAGTRVITVHFNGLSSTNSFPQAVLSEFYNVGSADGSSSSSTSRTAGSMTTTTPEDLIYHWGVDFSDTNTNGGNFNGTGITAGSGFTLLSADLQVGSADQYQVQSNAGAINPTFSASGSATWGSVALALKSANTGTPPPAGIRVVHVEHILLSSARAQSRPNPVKMQFPSSGNLLVGLFNSADVFISNLTDSAGNTWQTAGETQGGGQFAWVQILYAANASTSPNLGNMTSTLSGSTSSDSMLVLYDVTGAATSPFDKAVTNGGNQTTQGPLTALSITPATSNGIVFSQLGVDFHSVLGLTAPANVIDDTDVNNLDNNDPPNGGTDVSTLDMDNGYAHIYNSGTGSLTFTWTYTTDTPGGVQLWGAVATAFMASGGGATPPSAPTGLQVTVH
jgi:hypothetical protein